MKKPADGWYQREILPQASLLTWIEFKALFIAEYTQPLQVILNQLKAKRQGPTEGVKAFAHELRLITTGDRADMGTQGRAGRDGPARNITPQQRN